MINFCGNFANFIYDNIVCVPNENKTITNGFFHDISNIPHNLICSKPFCFGRLSTKAAICLSILFNTN